LNLCAVSCKSVSDLFNLFASGGVGEESDRRGLREREEKWVVSRKDAKGAKIKAIYGNKASYFIKKPAFP
jgi:hypothetical protein